MTAEKMKKERFDQLGLPPMELAESSANGRNSNAIYKCLLSILQKIMIILLFTILGVGTYILLSKILQNYDKPNNTQMIIIKENSEPSNMFHIIRLLNTSDNGKVITRNKRDTGLLASDTDYSELNSIANQDLIQKAKELKMKHDIICSQDDKHDICNLVTKFKQLLEINDVPKPEKESPKRTFKGKDDNDTTFSEALFTDLTKREVLPHFDNIIEKVSGPYDSKNINPYGQPYPSPHSHQTPDNCLLAMLKRYPRGKDLLDPSGYLAPQEHHHNQLLPLQARFYTPTAHVSYPQTRDIEVPQVKKPIVHPQDLEIIMSFYTPKQDFASTENPSNSPREVSCPEGAVPCLSGDVCIDKQQWCDGHVDCADVSDESRCTCKSRVDKSRLCDGYFDCPFGEDEMGCYGCSDNAFSCEDFDMNSQTSCFTKEQRCDNIAHCPNHKDELECNMLAPSLVIEPIFAVSNNEGFLHRNYKGEWYAVCKNPYMWAHDACRREVGLIVRPPHIQIITIDPMLKLNYINTDHGGVIQTSDTCIMNSSAVWVTCPDMLCGTRVQSTSQLLRENGAVENHLFGRNKRFLHPYPLKFYGNRWKRNIDDASTKTNYEINFDTPKMEDFFDKARNKRTESRVVGGKPSQPAAWPWMVAMFRDGMFHCGGVVLTHNWVISAAHCVHKFWYHYYEIQVGMLRRFSFSPQEHIHRVTHVIVNQHYSQTDMKNDLSLLKVEPSIQFSRWVRPICLPSPDTAGPEWFSGPAPGTICTAVGWGATTEHGPDPDHMREVEVPIWENCKHREDRAGKEICAGLMRGGKDACQGDSGGPLLCRNPLNSQQWYMAGIVSHGDGCGRKDEPGVYTRVSLFVKWIIYHTSSNTLPQIEPKQECPGFKCKSGISKCLPNKRKCDRIVDCLDGEDEVNCDFAATDFPNNFLFTPKPEELLATKEANTEPSNVLLHNSRENDESSQNKIENITQEADIITTTNKIDSISQESKSEERSNADSTENTDNIDFQHPSTVELSISKSGENLHFSAEHVTSDPSDVNSNESTPNSDGHGETKTIMFSGESLESRSLVQTTHRNIDDEINFNQDTTPVLDLVTENFTTTTRQDFIDVAANFETTTKYNLNENITTTTDNPKNMHQEERAEISNDLIQLLPNSLPIADQTNEESKHTEIKKENLLPAKNNHKDPAETKLSHFDDKSVMESIVFSELQPATTRRKHRVLTEFTCSRIFQTIPFHYRCDRKADCEDGTDELDCTCSDYLAIYDEKLICDGVFDCADGHDETNCYSCGEDQFLCKRSQVCVSQKDVCDGKQHCPEGEDELDCFALSNGKEIEYTVDERPALHLEGYLTQKHYDGWRIVCDDKISLDEQDQAATNICRYLGFSSANKFYVKYINVKEDEITKRSLDSTRPKRSTGENMPIHFAYRQENDGNDTARHIVLKDVQVLKEQCVPNITKTCKSLYVYCEQSLFTDFEEPQNVYLRNTETGHKNMWPWIAKIFVDGKYTCTGVLIDLSWVLVSDSCLWDITFAHNYTTVVLGSHRTLETTHGMHEQVYRVVDKKDVHRSKAILLRLSQPAHYSNVVKPMVISSSFTYLDSNSTCVAIGEDSNHHSLSVTLQETNERCHPSNRCFVRTSKKPLCPAGMSSNRHWAGVISCHTDRGWFPAATFVDSRGECGLGDHISATDIENLKKELHGSHSKNIQRSSTIDNVLSDKNDSYCEGIRCGRGRCISLHKMCDGVRDCEDGNDESENACEKKNSVCSVEPYYRGCECSAGQMKCRNGKCISKELFRDGNQDCGDGTDEPDQSTCSHYLDRVMPSRVCDGVLNCHDRSDEHPMYCKCFAKRTYKCMKSGENRCVAPDMVCDGIEDCPHGEDEHTCIGLNAPEGTPHGSGQVIVRSHGVWHSKCYSKQNHTKSELEAICAELGFISGHAKQIHETENFVEHEHNSLFIDPFNDIVLNNNTIIKMRSNQEPIATGVFDERLKDCYPLFIECL